MRSPADMQTIQIDITNACNKRCSNCTRFCGNHKKPFFMDYETFTKAWDSLEGYDGVIGVMGGEPTLHPQFERLVGFIQEKCGKIIKDNRMVMPQREFIKEIHRREFDRHILRKYANGDENFKMNGPGLWSNMGATYYDKYEIIQDTFGVQFLNDHINVSYHQPGLVSRRDLGIADDEWTRLRDNCWIQNEWSATITPKGAFFCEIAGALDILFDGPGGWPIEPGWWKRKPEDFGDQLHWCELCGFALDTFMRDAEEERDDVSDTLYDMLLKVDSPRMKNGRINLLKIENGCITDECKAPGKHFSRALPYMGKYEDRFCEANSALFTKDYDTAYIEEGEEFGNKLNIIINQASNWILLKSKENADVSDIEMLIGKHIFNPGTLHIGKESLFLSKKAISLREYGFERISKLVSKIQIIEIWDDNKIFSISELDEKLSWGRKSIQKGKKYAIWGTGLAGSFLADAVTSSGAELVMAIDADMSKCGSDFYGSKIFVPDCLMSKEKDFDYILIGHYSRFEEIKKQALEMGVPKEKIVLPYEV